MAAHLRPLAETDIRTPIPAEELLAALQTPPFVLVPGTFNTRDLGLLLLPPPPPPADSRSSSSNHPTRGIRPGFIFRTGGLDSLHHSGDGRAVLRDRLRVRRIFDLRSREEHARRPDPVLEGVENVWLGDEGGGGAGTEETPMTDLGPFVEGEGEVGYVAMYLDVLDRYRGTFREVLRSVRDRPREAIMFHCTGELVVFSNLSCFVSSVISLFSLPHFAVLRLLRVHTHPTLDRRSLSVNGPGRPAS